MALELIPFANLNIFLVFESGSSISVLSESYIRWIEEFRSFGALRLEQYPFGEVFVKNALARLAIATCAIALCLTSTPAWGCAFGKQKTTQVTWLRSPLVLLLAVPGTLLATALYWGGRSFEQQE